MKVALLGYARQGLSAYKYYSLKGADITICDQDETKVIPEGVESRLGPTYLDNLDEFDVLVRTPFLHPGRITAANPQSPDILSKITTVTNEFISQVSTPIIGVTGTKGKGTTSLLVEAMLKAAGRKVLLGGNIGISPFDLLDEAEDADYVVLELSNFQTMDLDVSPSVAVCLAVTPEHLDWHADYPEYLAAKAQMFANQASGDTAVYCKDSADSYSCVRNSAAMNLLSYSATDTSADVTIDGDNITVYGRKIAKVDDIKLLGQHNQHNVLAAIAACWKLIDENANNDEKPIENELRIETPVEKAVLENGDKKYSFRCKS